MKLPTFNSFSQNQPTDSA